MPEPIVLIYDKDCPACNACQSLRIHSERFVPSRSQKRIRQLNQDLELVLSYDDKPEYYQLYERYIRERHRDGSMYPPSRTQYKGFLHCDLLVIGAGPAGLMAALTAGRAGKRVILADEDFRMGGRLNAETFPVGGKAGADWAAAAVAELASLPNVRLMNRTTIVGAFDHGIYSAVERVSDHLAVPAAGKPRQTLWRIYSKRAILAGGATERPIAFENNDRPGVMTTGAVRTYLHRYGVAAGRAITIFANGGVGRNTGVE